MSARLPSEILRQCWFVVGPTACGKTDLAVQLAQRLDAEIIALDSMSLYRGMDIGTAKPSAELRRRIPHHMIDVIDPWQEYSVSEYVIRAGAIARQILQRRRIPLFVGGTGLYLRSLLRGVFDGPPADWPLRMRYQRLARQSGTRALHARLREVDPDSASRIHPNDLRRIVRALEVFETTGRPLSEWQRHPPLAPHERPAHLWFLRPNRSWLYARIEQRVEAMFAAGLEDEVRRLLELPHPLSRTARQAIGYKELIDAWEEAGTRHLAPQQRSAVIARIQTRTRQFAKRQYTWFNNLPECRPLDVPPQASPEDLARLLVTNAAVGHLPDAES